MSPLRRASTRNGVLVTIAIVAVVVALVLFIRSAGSRSRDLPTDKAYTFVCRSCKQSMQLTAREMGEMQEQRQVKMSGKGMLFKCKNCGQIAAERPIGPAQAVDESSAKP